MIATRGTDNLREGSHRLSIDAVWPHSAEVLPEASQQLTAQHLEGRCAVVLSEWCRVELERAVLTTQLHMQPVSPSQNHLT